MNTLYYGDNLKILRDYIPNESVDLVYLDPPFNSNRNYNVLFKDESGQEMASQIKAFEDTWHWSSLAEKTLYSLINHKAGEMLSALCSFMGKNQMTAYLVMITVRLIELHRVLKPTGSLYLHCDPTSSHYLKMVLDCVFGVENYRNEIVWQRSTGKSLTTRNLPNNHDIIFCFSKDEDYVWNNDTCYIPYEHDNLDDKTKKKYCYKGDNGRLYTLGDLTNPNPDRPNLTYEFLGFTKVWRWTKDRMLKAYEKGLVIQPSPGSIPRLKRYLDEQRGKPLGDVWDDIPPINSQAKERLGYPTQKPVALLERIIKASSNEGDVVLDPFCGCGTAIIAAQGLKRQWIGIDVTHLSIALQKYRLKDSFNIIDKKDYSIIGEPEDIQSARQLAQDDRYQFQWWAGSLIKAKPLGGEEGSKKGKKGSDKGIDAFINFIDEPNGKFKKLIVQVKSGKVKSGDIRDLIGVIQREQAAIGVFITLEQPSKDMREEATKAGFYFSPGWNQNYSKIQIYTIEELLNGKTVQMPPTNMTFKIAPRSEQTKEQGSLI